jgi:hypothetical protein
MKPSREQIIFETARLKREREERIYRHGENPNRIKPTQETLRKRKKDVIVEMQDRKHLDKDHVDAALEIREIFEKLSAGMFASASYDFSGTGSGRGVARQPIDRLTDRQGLIYQRCYTPWMNSVSKRYARPGLRLSEIVMTVIIDNYGCQQIADANGMALKTVRGLIADALDEYVHLMRNSRRG